MDSSVLMTVMMGIGQVETAPAEESATLLLALAIGLPLLLVEIRYEEARLLARFPDDFPNYQKAVPVLLPRFRK